MDAREWTLSEAARLLRQPQHRLIYLCEKGVVLPDLGDAQGRGSSRRFSARNLLEFALAFKLRELMVPVPAVGAVLYVLRGFELRVAQELPGFRLPDALRVPGSPELRIAITDSRRVFFALQAGGRKPRVFGDVDLEGISSTKRRGANEMVKQLKEARDGEAFDGDHTAKIEVSVSRVAKDLKLES